jgi:hypothetical protein
VWRETHSLYLKRDLSPSLGVESRAIIFLAAA